MTFSLVGWGMCSRQWVQNFFLFCLWFWSSLLLYSKNPMWQTLVTLESIPCHSPKDCAKTMIVIILWWQLVLIFILIKLSFSFLISHCIVKDDSYNSISQSLCWCILVFYVLFCQQLKNIIINLQSDMKHKKKQLTSRSMTKLYLNS